MALYKNVASQRVAVFAYDTVAQAPKTGDAANITARVSLDGGASAPTGTTNPTEVDATNMKGLYLFPLTQAESNADLFALAAVSATADVVLEPVIIYTLPGSAAGVHSAVQSMAANSLTAAAIAAAAMNGKGDWNIGKTGYSISGTKTTLDTLQDISLAGVNAEVDTALSDLRLGELMVSALGSQPAAGSLLGDLTEDDAGTQRFSANALEQAPTGGGGLTAQQVRDAMKLAPAAGTPDPSSVDGHLDSILTLSNLIDDIGKRVNLNNMVGAKRWNATPPPTCSFTGTMAPGAVIEIWLSDVSFADPVWPELSDIYKLFEIDEFGALTINTAEWVSSVNADVIKIDTTGSIGAGVLTFTVTTDGASSGHSITHNVTLPGGTGEIYLVMPDGNVMMDTGSFVPVATSPGATMFGYLEELGPTNLPADVDTLLGRITELRLAELDPGNLPADLDTLLARATEARLAELDGGNIPADVDALLSRASELRLSKLDVTGTLAHSDDADTYKADVSGVGATPAEIWAHIVETVGDITAEQILRAALAYVAGARTGGGTGTLRWFRPDDITEAIKLESVDEDGNTFTVTLDLD